MIYGVQHNNTETAILASKLYHPWRVTQQGRQDTTITLFCCVINFSSLPYKKIVFENICGRKIIAKIDKYWEFTLLHFRRYFNGHKLSKKHKLTNRKHYQIQFQKNWNGIHYILDSFKSYLYLLFNAYKIILFNALCLCIILLHESCERFKIRFFNSSQNFRLRKVWKIQLINW